MGLEAHDDTFANPRQKREPSRGFKKPPQEGVLKVSPEKAPQKRTER
jgi:hypothetical protein